MANGSGEDGPWAISPEEAFSVLGDETRLQILQALAEAERPLGFSELFDRVEYDDTANFSYHIEQLVGHFVRKTAEGYTLRHAGGRVVQAIMTGTVTENPVVERTPVETPCFLCDGQMEISYREERLAIYCEDCGGTRDESSSTVDEGFGATDDIVGGLSVPPTGVQDRTPTDLLRAAEIRVSAWSLALTRDVCPVCSAPIDRSVRVCPDHEASGGHCETCGQRFAITSQFECRNCLVGAETVFAGYLLGDLDLMAFMIDHGIDPIHPEGFHLTASEEVLSVDPFEARFMFTADDESITLTVDNDLSVVDATRNRAIDAGR